MSEVDGTGFWGGRSQVVVLTSSDTESMVTMRTSRVSSVSNDLVHRDFTVTTLSEGP